jgi:hypothetical protein
MTPLLTDHWMTRAACRNKQDVYDLASAALESKVARDTTLRRMYDRDISDAKAICRGCPVLDECRSWTLGLYDADDADGVVAAMTPHERRLMRRRRKRK